MSTQTVKHRIFISYHHGGDQLYYDPFSNAFHDTYDVIYEIPWTGRPTVTMSTMSGGASAA
jgi:hypothetical protein